MPPHIEIELDIFSGMPNPRWVLTKAEADHFMTQLAALPRTSAKELSGILGYRGCIVHVNAKPNEQLIRVQAGAVQNPEGYAQDVERELERWLLSTGKPHLTKEVLQVVAREIR